MSIRDKATILASRLDWYNASYALKIAREFAAICLFIAGVVLGIRGHYTEATFYLVFALTVSTSRNKS